jgi:phosphatidylglycerol:prolipoprotein diacylglycerol transferase
MVHTLAEAYLHQLDEFAIRIAGNMGIRWYALSYLAGFLVAWLFLRWMARTGRTPLRPEMVGDFMVWAMASVMIGGRLGYVLFYDQSLLGFTSDFPFWNVLAIHRGGMASHGGIIGVIIGCILFARRRGISALNLFDMGAVGTGAGFFLGRIANFVNAELWGKRLPDSMQSYAPGGAAEAPWWSVKYPQELLRWAEGATPFFAERMEALRAGVGSLVDPGPEYLAHVAEAARRGEAEIVTAVKPLLTAYYPSQLFQSLTDGLLVTLILVLLWWRPRKPGVIGASYLVAFGAMRIATEVFRQPDEGVALLLGLSRGQALSILIVAVGLILLPIFARRDVEKIGGFGKREPSA